MANEKDSLGILAQDIVDSVKTGSTSATNKAQYDKSYKCTIIGVNKRFTKDIPAEKQTELITKYSVPDEVEGDSYYFFKINGIYYCLQSNTDFKLYDEVNVRVPNNNWNKMFIETGKGESGETSTDYSLTLNPSNWEGNWNNYHQTISATWANTNIVPIVDLRYKVNGTVVEWASELEQYSYISKIDMQDGSVKFTCFEVVPAIELTLNFKVVK